MNKYYVRFNPGHIHHPSYQRPWMVIEVTDNGFKKVLLDSLNIQVSTWTEKSSEDNNFWNIACLGMLEINNFHGVISDPDLK